MALQHIEVNGNDSGAVMFNPSCIYQINSEDTISTDFALPGGSGLWITGTLPHVLL